MSRGISNCLMVLALAASLAGCASSGAEDIAEGKRQEAANANTQLAVQYLQRDEPQRALRKLNKAVRQDPSNPDTRMMLGIVYERLEKPDKAEAAFREAISLDPDNSRALNNFGRFLCENGSFGEAREYFDRAADNAVYETPEVPLTNAGICALRAGQTERAQEYLLKALQKNPRQPRALVRMAQLRYRAEEYLSARGYYQRYLAVARQTPMSAWLGVRIESQLGDEDAVASYKQLLRNKFPDSEETQELRKWENNERL